MQPHLENFFFHWFFLIATWLLCLVWDTLRTKLL